MHSPSTQNTSVGALNFERWKPRIALIAAGGVFAAGVRVIQTYGPFQTLLVHPYFVEFYTTSYSDGFRRRALVGSICRLLSPGGISVVWINILAVLSLSALLAVAIHAFSRLYSRPGQWSRMFTFVLFGSWFISSLFEDLGDTLQIAFLLFFVIAVLPASRVKSEKAKVFFGLCGVAVAFFIHEASIFFLIPCISFIGNRYHRVRDLALPVVVLGAFLALSMHWSKLAGTMTYHAISYPGHRLLASSNPTPGLSIMLREELQSNFDGEKEIVRFIAKCVLIASVAFGGFIALVHCFSSRDLRRTLNIIVSILLFSTPLWWIAHDWGRFLAYSFLLAIIVESSLPAKSGLGEEANFLGSMANGLIDKLTQRLQRYASIEAVQFAALLLLFASPYTNFFQGSRIFGMRPRDFLSCFAALVLIFGVARSHPVFSKAKAS